MPRASTGDELPPFSRGPIRVALVAEDPLVREVLRARIAEAPDLLVAIELSSHAELTTVTDLRSVHVVLDDVGLHGQAPSWELDDLPRLVLVRDPEEGMSALTGGAAGALPRDAPGAMLVEAIRAVAVGLVVSVKSMLPAGPRVSSGRALLDELTPREREVLGHLVEGLSNKAIAERLRISEHTAKFHVNAVLQKLGAQTRTEAVVRAARLGLVAL